jgi:hypothetical protein
LRLDTLTQSFSRAIQDLTNFPAFWMEQERKHEENSGADSFPARSGSKRLIVHDLK